MLKKKSGLVSIIIPTYKRPKMLGRAIESTLKQTYKNIEIIVVDDNDENSEFRKATEDFMERYKNNPNIKYVKHNINKGGALARNTGINIANGEYISFLDDDDEYLPEKIEKQMEKMLKSDLEDLAFIYCQMDIYDEKDRLIGRTKNYFRGNEKPFKENMIKCIAGTPSLLIKSSVLKEIGGFKKLKSGQDWFLILQVLEKGYNVDYLSESLVNVHIHNEERISNGHWKIQSINGEIMNIKKKYLHTLDDKYKNLVLYEHYMQLANHTKHISKTEALKYFMKAFRFEKFNERNLFFIGSLFITSDMSNKIKKLLSKVR